MNKSVYNVYDNGELVLESVFASEVREFLGSESLCVANYATFGTVFAGRYTISKADEDVARSEFARAWNEAVAPFKRVQWVKRGGRKLGGY